MSLTDGTQRWIVPVAATTSVLFAAALFVVAGVALWKLRKKRKRYITRGIKLNEKH